MQGGTVLAFSPGGPGCELSATPPHCGSSLILGVLIYETRFFAPSLSRRWQWCPSGQPDTHCLYLRTWIRPRGLPDLAGRHAACLPPLGAYPRLPSTLLLISVLWATHPEVGLLALRVALCVVL